MYCLRSLPLSAGKMLRTSIMTLCKLFAYPRVEFSRLFAYRGVELGNNMSVSCKQVGNVKCSFQSTANHRRRVRTMTFVVCGLFLVVCFCCFCYCCHCCHCCHCLFVACCLFVCLFVVCLLLLGFVVVVVVG